MIKTFFACSVFLFVLNASCFGQTSPPGEDTQWPTYGGDPGGERYSASKQITAQNVNQLQVAWTFHTGVTEKSHGRTGSFEATPILFKGSLYFASPFDEVFALDPATGQKRWSFDPQIDWGRNLGIVTSRAVASWTGPHLSGSRSTCADRIFLGTLDARLIALDAATGQLCADFGDHGSVDLSQNVDYRKGDDYAVTSPPTVVGDVVVVGSGIEDNLRVDVERGDVRGFDVHTGKLLWTWEPLPWANHQKVRTGGGNTWGVIAADPEHGLLYLPTSSPSPDYYGGTRPGDNRDANSIVCLDAKTGRKVWAFQLVHHDIWDYDIAAEPLLFTFRGSVPAVAVASKIGTVFVLNRLTGEPLYPVHERPVPQSDVPGETSSPTQPFTDLPALVPLTFDTRTSLGENAVDDAYCRKVLSRLDYRGLFTPPSLRGTLLYPSNIGGVNWGSTALDPETGILYANTNRMPFIVRLQKRPRLSAEQQARLLKPTILLVFLTILAVVWLIAGKRALGRAFVLLLLIGVVGYVYHRRIERYLLNSTFLDTGTMFAKHFGKEYGENSGAPYVLLREPLANIAGHPCSELPWGTVSALNLNTGQSAWETPLGTEVKGQHTGTVNVGGPIVTAGGLVFTAASQEAFLRAFDSATGKEIWTGKMPVPSQATPMSYSVNGKQFIVIADGGHYTFGTAQSDGVIAYALP